MCPVCAFRAVLENDGETVELPSDPTPADPPASSAQLRFEHYQVVTGEDGTPCELGRGGMGVTYKAIDINLQNVVALKVINPRFTADESVRRRFVREARAAASIRHPNVASVFHLGKSGENYFYAMEFVEGEPLSQALKRMGRLEAPIALRILTLVASGLEAIAKQNLVHRDIKPANIMISWQGDEIANAKIIDLGLAKGLPPEADAPSEISLQGVFVGTPAYTSPERFAGLGADIRSDLYSLGITLWQMLSGELPLQGSLSQPNHQGDHTPLPLEKLPQVPQPIAALLETLLQKDPAKRFQTPTELLQAIPKVTTALESRRRVTIDQLRSSAGGSPAKWNPLRALALALGDRAGRSFPWLPALGLSVAGLFLAWVFFSGHAGFLLNQPGSEPLQTIKSVAVLPFDNISANQDDVYFADGVQDDILNSLAKIAQLKVISRTSVMQYRDNKKRDLRQIANALGVTNVLEGTVRRAGNRVRVSTELVDANNDSTIWADSYDRELTDIFTIQSDIAQTVAAKLSARLSPHEKKGIAEAPTSDAEAYDLYLRAKELIANAELFSIGDERENYLNAIAFLQEAVRKDPRFVLAYCLAARVHDDLYMEFDRSAARRALADAAVQEATRLQPDLPEVHLAAARQLYDGYRDLEKARLQVAMAERALPNSSDVLTLGAIIDRRQGRWDESTKRLKRAMSLDPRNLEITTRVFENYLCLRRFRDAEDASRRLVELGADKPGLRVKSALCAFSEHADIADYRAALEALPPTAKQDISYTFDRIYCAALDHDWTSAKEILSDTSHQELFFLFGLTVPRECIEIWLAMAQGERPKPEGKFALAAAELKQRSDADPTDAKLASALGIIDAALGRKDEAIQEAKHAVELEPITKDAMEGPGLLYNLAVVYAQTGEPDLAFQQLAILVKTPSQFTNYGYFKLECGFDPLRKDPRFVKLLAQLAPRD
ncbi:MAG: protein kinase [Verrucomicrobia bacterium]|nr:protein kinase [Verrucomicrobiota bacterium]